MVTEYGLSCIQPSPTSLSSVLVQEPDLKLLPSDAHGTHMLHKTVFNVVPLGGSHVVSKLVEISVN
jgi:hypothetical protein